MHRSVATLVATLLLSIFTCAALRAQEAHPVFFFVVAVSSPEYYEQLPVLDERANRLIEFFKATYPNVPNDHIRIFNTREKTTRDSLREMLFEQIPQLPPESFVFLFIMSHGELLTFLQAPPDLRLDLAVIASDTSPSHLGSTSIRGAEVLDAFSRAPMRSLIFTFLDLCNAAAVTSLEAEFADARSHGSRAFVVASSAGGLPSYYGEFTEAVMNVWHDQNSDCITEGDFLRSINSHLANGQAASIVMHFAGPCVNLANSATGWLVIATPSSTGLNLAWEGSTKPLYLPPNQQSYLVALPRTTHQLSMSEPGPPERMLAPISIDFSVSPFLFYDASRATTADQVASNLMSASAEIKALGFGRESQSYALLAAGVLRQGGKVEQAGAIEAGIDRRVAPQELVAVLDYNGARPLPANIDKKKVAQFLAASGRLTEAATIDDSVLERNTADPHLFGGLYTSLTIGGRPVSHTLLRPDEVSNIREILAMVSTEAHEALERSQAAGKMSEGKFLFETVLTNDGIKFAPNDSTLSPKAKEALDAFAATVKTANKPVYIEIQGHTDSVGPETYNRALGQARAEAVRRYLNQNAGIPLHRMNVISFGGEDPLVNNKTSHGRAENRRVSLVILE